MPTPPPTPGLFGRSIFSLPRPTGRGTSIGSGGGRAGRTPEERRGRPLRGTSIMGRMGASASRSPSAALPIRTSAAEGSSADGLPATEHLEPRLLLSAGAELSLDAARGDVTDTGTSGL